MEDQRVRHVGSEHVRAPYWVLGYEIDGKLTGRRTKDTFEVGGVIFYTITPNPDVSILKKLSSAAMYGRLSLMNPREVLPFVAAELNSSLRLHSLLKRIQRVICSIIEAEAASILVHTGDHLEFMVTEGGASGRIESIPVPMESIAGTIFLEEKTMIFNDLEKEKRHFKGVDRAAKFVTKNIVGSPIWAGDRKFGVIEVLNKEGGFTEEDAEILESFARLIGRKLSSTIENERIKNLLKEIVVAITTALDKRDKYTHQHSRNVAQISVMIGRKMGLSEKELEDLEVSAILHDIGKIGIPDSILLKPGRLTPEEFEYIKKHTIFGGEMLQKLKHVTESMIAGAVEHHERCDGSGYPYGKKCDEISLFGKIIAVADVYDALTAKRVYKEGWDKWRVLEMLKEDAERGKFDKGVVEKLEELLKEGAL